MPNRKQKLLLIIGSLLFVALGLYPPWRDKGPSDYSLGYALIFQPPRPDSRIDLARLSVEWLCVVALIGSLAVALRQKRAPEEAPKPPRWEDLT